MTTKKRRSNFRKYLPMNPKHGQVCHLMSDMLGMSFTFYFDEKKGWFTTGPVYWGKFDRDEVAWKLAPADKPKLVGH